MEPLVSIIIPVYNAAPHLARCLESVRRQKYRNIEAIVVNDGSHDASWKIVDMYARLDKRIVGVDRQNCGVAATRNLGIQLAKGDYLQFVDADDYLDENYTRLMLEKLEERKADLVISHYCHLEGEKKTVYGFLENDEALGKKAFALGLMQQPASFYYGVMWNKLYRADIIHKHDIRCNEELEWSEDFLFNLEYIRHARRFAALQTPVYYYVYNPKSIVHTKIDLAGVVKQKTSMFAYYKKLYQELGLYDEYKARIHHYLIATAEHL